jgi:vacuolar-type H+-ATPase subunit I/STV1
MVKKRNNNYKSWILIVAISFIISIIINFNKEKFIDFLIGSLIFGFVLIGVLILITKSVKGIKERNIKKAILFGVLSIIAIIISFCGYILFSYGMCETAITSAHLRTNILTGQCNFGGYSGCHSPGPWYYKSGCNISLEEKVELAKRSRWYNMVIEECNDICYFASSSYCSDVRMGISCNELVKCASISC